MIVSPQDLILGKNHLGIIFASDLFIAKNGLDIPESQIIRMEPEGDLER